MAETQHQPVQGYSRTSSAPPEHQDQIYVPSTRPTTAEETSDEEPVSVTRARDLVILLDFLKDQRDPDDCMSWVELSVHRDIYISERESIEQSFSQHDYDPNRGLLTLRWPPNFHGIFAPEIAYELHRQLRQIGKQKNNPGMFACKLMLGGSATVQLAEGDSKSFQAIRRDPDAQYLHPRSRYPGVVKEVSYSQDGKDLRKLAEDYILYSKGDIKAVVGVDVNHTGKESTVSLWRAKWTSVENDGLKNRN